MSISSRSSINENDKTEAETLEVDENADTGMSKKELNSFIEKVEKIARLGEHDQKVFLVQNQIQEKHREAEAAQNGIYEQSNKWAITGGAIGGVVSIALILTVFRDFFTQTGTALDYTTMGMVTLLGAAPISGITGIILSAFTPKSWKLFDKKDQAEEEINILRKELVEKSLDAKILTEITDFSNNWQEIVASKDGEVKGFVIRFESNKKGFEWIEQREFIVK